MIKKTEPKEKKKLSSGEFTKLFIKNFILNSIFVGIILYIVYELAKEFLPGIVTTILSFVLVFAGIVKIYLSALKESFCEGKIYQSDINKIAKNIIFIFLILLLINVGLDYISYASSLKLSKVLGLENMAFRNLIINTVINIVLYTIIAISCRIKFLKECNNKENII